MLTLVLLEVIGGHILQYAVPVLPVIVSWIISTVALYKSMNLANASDQGITPCNNHVLKC